MRTFLSTCDEYIHLLQYFPYFWEKHWGKPETITVLGFDPPNFRLPDNFNFVSLGREDDFRFPSNPSKWSWSDALLPFFKSISDPYFLYLWDEQFPCTTANHTIISRMETAIAEDRAQTAYLAFQECHRPGHKIFDSDVVEISQRAPYRTSIHTSIWRTERFLRYLRPGMTAWDFEQKNMVESMSDGDVVIESAPEKHGMYVFDIYRAGIYNDKEYDLRIRDMLDQDGRNKVEEMRRNIAPERKA